MIHLIILHLSSLTLSNLNSGEKFKWDISPYFYSIHLLSKPLYPLLEHTLTTNNNKQTKIYKLSNWSIEFGVEGVSFHQIKNSSCGPIIQSILKSNVWLMDRLPSTLLIQIKPDNQIWIWWLLEPISPQFFFFFSFFLVSHTNLSHFVVINHTLSCNLI